MVTDTTKTMSERLVEFANDLTLADIPADVRHVARMHMLDAFGTALAASTMEFGRVIHEGGAQLGAADDSRVLGFGTRLPAASAALVNGTLIHSLDFDDTHIGAIYHATAPALAAALAVADEVDATGAELLTAYTIGLEVGCRIAAGGAGKFGARGFHPTAIAGAFAATAVASKLRRQPGETTVRALGLAGSQAAGILEVRESWLKRFHPGWAAHSGVVASTIAGAGFIGPRSIFDGPRGLYATHIGEVPTAQAAGLDDLGTRWMTSEIALKPYPCCHFTHAFIDAAKDVSAQLGVATLDPDDIVAIECPIAPGMIPSVVEPVDVKRAPQTLYQALFSVPYAVALTLVRGRVDLAAFYDEPLDDPDVLRVAALVECPADSTSDFPSHFSGEVRVKLKDGRVISKRIVDSFGTSQWPLSDKAIRAKFRANAARALPEDQLVRLEDLITGIEEVTEAQSLLAAATTPTSARL